MGRARVEVAARQANDIDCRLQTPETGMNAAVAIETLWRVVGQDHTKIQIAVCRRFPARFRAKKVDAKGMVEVNQTPRNFGNRLLFRHD
jgi:hypothetical protein